MPAIKTDVTVKTSVTIDLRQFQSQGNGYDLSLPHPLTSKITFIGRDGSEVKISIGQLSTLAAIVDKATWPTGYCIDHMFDLITDMKKSKYRDVGIAKHVVSGICNNF